MTDKHTPGPWIVNDCTRRGTVTYRYRICREEGRDAEEIAVVETHSALVPELDCVNEANARLIAAAPELLAALREFVPESAMDRGQTFEDRERLRKIFRAAIAKATQS